VCVTALFLFWLVRRSTRMLSESEERFRLLVEGAPDAVLVESGGRIRYVNAAVLRLVGASDRGAIIGKEIAELVPDPALKAIRQRLTQVERLKLPVNSQEVSFRRADGKEVCCEVSAAPITYCGDEGALIFIRDTTDRSRCQERVMSAQRMETVKKLAGGLAHDLNNLLQGINGYAELAYEALPEGEECRGYLEQVRISGQRATGLVSKLLAFSKNQDPRQMLSEFKALSTVSPGGTQRLDLRAVLAGVCAQKSASAGCAGERPCIPGNGGKGRSVLLAEDDDMVRSLSAKILARDGFKVLEAEDGDVAVRLYQEHGPEIAAVVLDVVMPHVDGFQAHDQIRAINASVPILFASGYSGIDSPSHVVLEPGVNLLQKPFDSDVLLCAVRRACGE